MKKDQTALYLLLFSMFLLFLLTYMLAAGVTGMVTAKVEYSGMSSMMIFYLMAFCTKLAMVYVFSKEVLGNP